MAFKLFMRNFPVKIVLPAVLGLVLLCGTIFIYLLPYFEETLITHKKQLVKELVTSVHSILKEYKKLEDSGELSRKEAQQRSIKQVSHMRYGKELKDYFWINTMEPRMVMHPYRPELNGKDLSTYKDPQGNRLFFEATVIVSKQGSGYINYMWQWKDDPDRIVQKISYVKGFEPWGWVIGSGIYIEDVHDEISLVTRMLSFILAGIFCVTALLTAYISWQGIKAETELQRQNQIATGQAELANCMRGDQDISTLGINTVTFLAKYLGAQMASLYLVDESEETLTLTGSYAVNKRKSLNEKIKMGEGIAGQAALEKKVISVVDVPKDYVRISSTLGDVLPRNILATPFVYEDKLVGVVEFATFREFSGTEVNFWKVVNESVAIAFHSAHSRRKMKEFLEESQRQSEELEAQTEKLQSQQEKLRVINEELEQQSEELRASNEELEEKTEVLERQKFD